MHADELDLITDRDTYDVLGAIIRNIGDDDVSGEEMSKKDMAAFGISAGTEILSKVVSSQLDKKAAAEAEQDASTKAQAMIALDRAATQACADAMVAAKSGDAAKIAAAEAVAAQATHEQDQAAAVLPALAVSKRVAAAQEEVKIAVAAWKKSPNSFAAEARVKCAQATLKKAQSGAGTGTTTTTTPSGEPSFFLRMAGPLPVWGWGVATVGAGAVVTAIVMILKKRR